MAIPLSYNARSVLGRWPAAVVAVVGIAGSVAVFIAMLAMARGFEATLAATGSPGAAIVRRAGASSEMESAVALDQVRVIGDQPSVARGDDGQPLVSPEVVVIAAFPLASSGTDANVQVRGVTANALAVHQGSRLAAGRFFRSGLPELVVGRNAAAVYSGLKLGDTPAFGGQRWEVVGVLDSAGSAFDSEVWCDAALLSQMYKRPVNVFQSVTVRLTSPDAFAGFKDALTADPRLTVQVDRLSDYYARQSRVVSTLIRVLGFIVALVMGIGSIFAALNTMYSAVAARAREIATLRAIGFGGGSVVLSFMVESLLLAVVGGALGCLAALPMNGFTTGTINWQTFSHLAFAFKVTPGLLLGGMLFAAFMGLLGGLPPALRAARLPVAAALREL